MRNATFTVFRIPAAQIDDLDYFVNRSNQFADAAYRSDVVLVSGEFGLLPGDTSAIQCINAGQLADLARAGRVFKVFDYPTCDPDFLVTGPAQRLKHFLADSSAGFAGGVIYDVSHGNGDAIYARYASPFVNLGIGDLEGLPAGSLNVFVSLSCDNDAPRARRNFATDMYLHDSVAVVSATQSVFPTSSGATIDAEVNAFLALYQSPTTLLQALHRFRAAYYGNYVISGPVADRPHNWINLLAVHVLGDGLTIVAQY